jgi:hypothetical protein
MTTTPTSHAKTKIQSGCVGRLNIRQVDSRDRAPMVDAKVPMNPVHGGAEGSRTPDLLSAIHSTEILADHEETLAKMKEEGGCPASSSR